MLFHVDATCHVFNVLGYAEERDKISKKGNKAKPGVLEAWRKERLASEIG